MLTFTNEKMVCHISGGRYGKGPLWLSMVFNARTTMAHTHTNQHQSNNSNIGILLGYESHHTCTRHSDAMQPLISGPYRYA